MKLKKYSRTLITFLVLFISICGTVKQVRADWPRVVSSVDGVPISYEVYGMGEQTLVFVHGWSCDSRYWKEQLPYFSKKYRVIVLDLAGHGHSGLDRSRYSMKLFGEDVRAVTEATGSSSVILIGHSMAGIVIAEAARLMPDRVSGLIGIDTLGNVEYQMTRNEYDEMVAPLKKDFTSGSQDFVSQMIRPQSDAQLTNWILSDMSAAPAKVALSAMEEMMSLYISGSVSKLFDEIRIPVITVSADLWPIDYEANRRHMLSFDAIVLRETDHFLMMNRSKDFNLALEKAINTISKK